MHSTSFDPAQFIGHFHPVLVHLPIGVFIAVCLLEFAALLPAWKHLAASNRALLWIATTSGFAAATCGWLLATDGGYDAELLGRHRWAGVAAAIGLAIALALHHLGRHVLYRLCLVALLPLLSIAGHFGGDLTHGKGFLTRHAPETVRRWLGETSTPNSPASSPATHTDPLQRPVFESFVLPVMDSYCTACHGREKTKGDLRVDSLEAMLKGGESGATVVPGKSTESSLISRVRLPLSHDEHMPPEGKPQPSAGEVAMLAWWIDAGAAAGKNAAELQAPENIRQWLTERGSTPKRP